MKENQTRTEEELNTELAALMEARFLLLRQSTILTHRALEIVGEVLDKIKKAEEANKDTALPKRKITSRKLQQEEPEAVLVANFMLAEKGQTEIRALELINSANKAAADTELGITPVRMLHLWAEEIHRELTERALGKSPLRR